MNKPINRVAMLIVLLVTLSFVASAQIEVRIRPAAPVERRTIAPSRRHVWIEGGWVYRGNGYVYTPGYWVVPRPGMVWVPGRWRRSHRGWIWIPGQWRRRF